MVSMKVLISVSSNINIHQHVNSIEKRICLPSLRLGHARAASYRSPAGLMQLFASPSRDSASANGLTRVTRGRIVMAAPRKKHEPDARTTTRTWLASSAPAD